MRARTLPVLVVLALAGATGCGSGDDPPTKTVAPQATTKVVRGFEFQASLPAGWADVRDQVQPDSSTDAPYDIAYGNRATKGYKPTVIVARHRSAAITKEPVADLVADIRRTEAGEGAPKAPAPTTLKVAGADARQTTTRGKQDGRDVVQRQIFAKHDDSLFTITFTSAVGDADADRVLAAFLASWKWTG